MMVKHTYSSKKDRRENMLLVRRGEEKDYKAIQTFIAQSEAEFNKESLFIVVENEKKELVGVVGILIVDKIGLLRSFVFSSSFPNEKLPIFLERILVVASENQCESLYLVTNKKQSVPFFQAFAFSIIEQEEVPVELKLSTGLSQLFQKDNSIIMWKTM